MINRNLYGRYWQWKIGGCIALAGYLSVGVSKSVLAQIIPDNTLGAEGSIVTPNVNVQGIPSDLIDGGTTRGANLFHSFEQFNVGASRGAYFTNPVGIENILSRVTGANRSEILGRLGVLGNANLFLINPQGIVFGSGASLDVKSSFLATTADAVKLGNGGLFSASQPVTSNLLTVSPSAFLFNAIAAQGIVNRSQSSGSIGQSNSADVSPGLQVQPDRTLALIGGNVLIEGGNLTAAGGRIELGSVAGIGEVGLTLSGNRFTLKYDSINNFGNISLSNGASVDVSGEEGGDVQIRGARLEMTQSSSIRANILGTQNGGEVKVNTTEAILSEGSSLEANVTRTGTAVGADLTINTDSLLVRDGSVISTDTLGKGKGGNLQITASELVEVIGIPATGQSSSGLYTQSSGSGDTGDLTINTGRLLVRDGAQVASVTFDEGKGGNLQITASELVEVIGIPATGQRISGLAVQSSGSGNTGNLKINTGRLLVGDGAVVANDTSGQGKGGSLEIIASESVKVIGTAANGRFLNGLLAQNQGIGDAGDLRIDTGRLLLSDGALITSNTFSEGKGGSLEITASESVEVIGTSANGRNPSSLATQSFGSGDAGNLRIDTARLLLNDGANITSLAFDEGKGGSLQITASESVEVISTSTNARFSSRLVASSIGSGDAGNLRIDTGRLLVRDGAAVSTDTFVEGKGGSLEIIASESVEVIGTSADGKLLSSLLSQNQGSGTAGNLRIDTSRLIVSDGALVSTTTASRGEGGSLQIVAADAVVVMSTSANGLNPSGLVAQSSRSGEAGDLRIDTGRLLIRDGALVSIDTFGEGEGGSLQIVAADAVEVIGTSADGQLLSVLAAQSYGSGNAGDLRIDTSRLLVRDGAGVSVSTFGEGKGGSLQIVAADTVEVISTSADGQNRSALVAQSGIESSGDAGDLRIDTSRLLVSDGALVSVSTFGEGKGGSLQIIAADAVEVIGTSIDGLRSSALAAVSGGERSRNAGELRIDTGRLLVRDGAFISSVSVGDGTAGDINITARNTLQADSGRIVTSTSRSSGGAIAIKAEDIRLINDSDIRAIVNEGTGGGGKISLSADSILAFDDSDILAFARDGRGGDITLNTPAFFGENYRPAPRNTNPDTLNNNNQVDINATGAVSGIVTIPNVSFIQNSLIKLPENQIDTNSLLANSCIVRRNQPTRGSFTITGTGGLPQRPGDVQISSFPTVDVETLPTNDSTPATTNSNRSWQKGDPIVEPQGVYQLPNGKLVLSRECS